MSPDEADQLLLLNARDRATLLLAALTADADAFRAAKDKPDYTEGAAFCDRAIHDARQLLAALETMEAAARPLTPGNERPES